jgi:26S proteasome regulatory subunit N8
LFRQYVPDPVFVIIDVRPDVAEIPTTAYHAIEEIQSDGKDIERVFKHIPCRIEADEAEEVGVEHLLRDINDPTTSTLIMQIKQKIFGIKSFVKRLEEIKTYLENVLSDRLPVNNQILYNLQNIFNLLPNMNHNIFLKSLTVEINDISFVIYLSSLIRAVLALHSLLQNKIQYHQQDIDLVLDRSAGVITANGGGNEPTQVLGTNGTSEGTGDDKMEEEKK